MPLQTHPTPPTTRKNLLPRKHHDHENPPQDPPKTTQDPRRRFRAAFDAARSRWAFSSAAALGARAPLLPLFSAWRRGVPPMGRPVGFSPFPSLRLRRPRVRFRPRRSGSRRVRALPRARPRSPRSPSAFGRGYFRRGAVAGNPRGNMLLPRAISRPPIPPPWCCFFWGAAYNPQPTNVRFSV